MIKIFLYIFFIVLADVLAARWIIPIGFGLMVPAGVIAIAPIFTLRDDIHRQYGAKWALILILVASGISYGISIVLGNEMLGRVTIASVIAFVVSEFADTLVYHMVKHESWMSRVLKSNAVSTLLDSIIFIVLAFGWIWPLILGQYICKMLIAGLVGLMLRKKKDKTSITELES